MTGLSNKIEVLTHEQLTCVSGGMIKLDRLPHIPPDQPHGGGLPVDYWATAGTMRFGAGPWDYGYGSPTGPWPV
ncbi:MAG TPA: hypothetical protein PKD88_00710 [Nitrosomonas sp.]|nr:hypothetical protein [Nitrosomonas sp.]HMW19506.1 hypothetical protein [Nitrosomonas sp.]HMW69912.1 hypothetical protein [Nitrosomonas sp.]HMY61335.1 hypothetical protein [Nitrosomonas sp.]HMY89701.1 hypothetical protein [Nitrosomonas sp.]